MGQWRQLQPLRFNQPTNLNNGSVYFFSDLLRVAAYYAEFLVTGSAATVLMSAADTSPTSNSLAQTAGPA